MLRKLAQSVLDRLSRRPVQPRSHDSDRPDGIGRIVFVKTSSWLLSENERPSFTVAGRPTPVRYADHPERPLRRLLGGITRRGTAGRAWLSRASYDSDVMSPYRPAGPDTAALAAELTRGVQDAWDHSRGWVSAAGDTVDPQTVEALLRPLGHRVFLDADRFEAVLGPEPAAELTALRCRRVGYYVVLDLRFFYLLDQLRCHVSTSVWSHVPRHRHHRPPGLADTGRKALTCGVDTYHRLFCAIADAAEKLLDDCGFVRADGTVGDGAHALPEFWVVRPSRPSLDPMSYLQDDGLRCRLTNHLARALLDVGDVRDSVVSHSVLNGDLFTLRRPLKDRSRFEVPLYLMIPGGPRLTRDEHVEQVEFGISRTITRLTELEAVGASELLAAKADLEIWRNHLSVYNAVVERAVFLWDALSTHLPIRRGPRLGRVYRAVGLLQQMLLQAVGDLGHIDALIRQGIADITETADNVSDTYRLGFTERRDGGDGLRAALTETGLFAHVKREAREIATEADRVKKAYADLLGAVAHAFDERRARELDVIQKSNWLVSIVLAGVGLVAVLDATVTMKPDGDGVTALGGTRWLEVAGAVTSWIAGSVVVVSVFVIAVRTWWISQLGSDAFRERYDGKRLRRWWHRRFRRGREATRGPGSGVWQMLKDVSTDRLERKAEDPDTDWVRLDSRLARQFATAWDEVTRMPVLTRANAVGHDIRALATQIEQWGMHSLLLTERARRSYRYELPVLTCLFRCCSRVDGSFLDKKYLSRTINMVATEDFDRSMTRVGFTASEIREVDNWLTGRRYRSASDALSMIQKLGLRTAMPREDRQAALAVVRAVGFVAESRSRSHG